MEAAEINSGGVFIHGRVGFLEHGAMVGWTTCAVSWKVDEREN